MISQVESTVNKSILYIKELNLVYAMHFSPCLTTENLEVTDIPGEKDLKVLREEAGNSFFSISLTEDHSTWGQQWVCIV